MTTHKPLQKLAALALTIVLVMALTPKAFAAGSRMDNFKKELTYQGFSDVSENAWYAKNVQAVYELGLMNGKSETAAAFDPNGQLTVAEAITLAVRVSCIYYNIPCPSGGTPWYQSAVDFAEEYHIISEGQFAKTDYNRPATRAEVAMLLFKTISISDFNRINRINRITYIPDITTKTPGWNEIYLLYNAGVLTGKGTIVNGQLTGDMAGSFFPDDTVTRAEAAAIMHRVAVPSERVNFSLSGHRPGEVVTAANNSFRISIPRNEGWKIEQNLIDDNGIGTFYVSQEEGSSELGIMTFPTQDWAEEDATTEDIADIIISMLDETGEVITERRGMGIMRGLYCYGFNFYGETFSGQGFCTESQEFFYVFLLLWPNDDAQAQYSQLSGLMLSLDMAL